MNEPGPITCDKQPCSAGDKVDLKGGGGGGGALHSEPEPMNVLAQPCHCRQCLGQDVETGEMSVLAAHSLRAIGSVSLCVAGTSTVRAFTKSLDGNSHIM